MAERDIPVVRYNEATEPQTIQTKWWTLGDEDVHKGVFQVVRHIREKQSYRSLNNLRFARLYGNMEIMGLQAGLFARVADPQAFLTNRLSLNVIAACVDTVSSKIAKDKTRPLFLTEEGDWQLQRRAELLTRFMEGAFDSMGTGQGDARTLYGAGRRAFVDAGIMGTGVVKFYADHREQAVKSERVIIEEIVVDETEGMYEGPRQMHQEKLVDRGVMADLSESKYRDKIMNASSGLDPAIAQFYTADMIKVVESWHLPSGGKTKDGKKALSIDGCTLDLSEWKRDYFPFLFKRWKPRILGFYGSGIAEELLGIQLEINKLVRTIAIAQHLCAVPQVWLEAISEGVTPSAKIDNEIGGVKYYRGRPPIFSVGGAMPAEVYQHLWQLWQKAFEVTGVSQLSATGKKPAGVEAAVAMRELQDIESERFALVQQRDQDFYIEAAYMTMDLMEELNDPSVRVVGPSDSATLNWKDVCIDRKKLKVRAFPTDILPSQPAGKLSKVQEMTQGGFFDKDEAYELLDFPDLKHVTSLKLAPRQNVRRLLERMIDKGEEAYAPPEPYMNLEICRNMAQAYYNRGQVDNMPEDRLELLRRFMDDTQAEIDKKNAAQMGAGAPPGAAGPGGQAAAAATEPGGLPAQPAQPPVSDLLPIAQ